MVVRGGEARDAILTLQARGRIGSSACPEVAVVMEEGTQTHKKTRKWSARSGDRCKRSADSLAVRTAWAK